MLPTIPSMYSSLSESTVLSSADTKPARVFTFFEASKEFLQFLSARTGMHETLLYEDTLGVDIKVETNGFSVTHPPDVPVKPIEMGLKKLFFDVEFTKCLRLSTLTLRCPSSQELSLSPAQYALLHENKLAITRSAGLADILMDHDGRSCMFGTNESVIKGRLAVKRMFNENCLGPFHFKPSVTGEIRDQNNNNIVNVDSEATSTDKKTSEEGLTTDISHPPAVVPGTVSTSNSENSNSQSSSVGRGQSIGQSGSTNSFDNEAQLPCPAIAPTTPQTPSAVLKEQRKSIRFFVGMSDAPRLIGSRGANKRRIEQLTGCNILLHTEKKEHGEFPVEVFSSSVKRCEMARQHILSFLSSGYATVDEASASLSGVKNKDVRVRPKVHLDISPKKLPKRHAD
ncbi:hypothetical protein RB195_011947 [Necator americanus]